MDILPPKKIKIIDIKGKGLGVVATEDIAAGEIIETCPVIFLTEKDSSYIKNNSDFLKFYYLEQALTKKDCLMLGYGSLYNHSPQPNADIDYDAKKIKRYLTIEATKDIRAGEEITFNYDDYDDKVEFLNLE